MSVESRRVAKQSSKHPDFCATGDQLPHSLFKPRVKSDNIILDELGDLANHIKQYSVRELTYEKDSLNAFRGILARSPFRSYWGIPVGQRQLQWWDSTSNASTEEGRMIFDTAFATGLCWTTDNFMSGPTVRRKRSLPSWSWTGWTGRIYCNTDYHTPARFPVSFWIPSASDANVRERLANVAASTSENIIPDMSQELHIEAYVVKIVFQPEKLETRRERGDAIYGTLCFEKLDGKCHVCASTERWHPRRGVHLYHASGRHDDMFDRPWEALILPMRGGEPNNVSLLVVEQHDGFAERIGFADAPFEAIDCLPKTQKRMTLK
jgi:hypothetical protein